MGVDRWGECECAWLGVSVWERVFVKVDGCERVRVDVDGVRIGVGRCGRYLSGSVDVMIGVGNCELVFASGRV